MLVPFERPLTLALLPLSLLPWMHAARAARAHPWLGLLPVDRIADAFGVTLKIAATTAVACCVLGIAGPFWVAPPTDHVGPGAEIVLVLDRSLSMDQSFGRSGTDSILGGESKGAAARRLLAEFARRRPHDLMAMLTFSTAPIRISGFTNQQSVIQAAIAAAGVGHGIADTDIGRALIAALGMFRGRSYTGSRVILLVSDGGARLDDDIREKIAGLLKREHVALYWLYLRTTHSPGLLADHAVAAADQEVVPEHFLHRYFSTMGAPYHAYEAENPDALAHAIADVDRLQSQPIRYRFAGEHHDLTGLAYAIALACAVMLMLTSLWEVREAP